MEPSRWLGSSLPSAVRSCIAALIADFMTELITARLRHLRQVGAESPRLFELNVYHAVESTETRRAISKCFQTARQTQSECERLVGAER